MKKNILENAGHGSLGHRIFCILRDKILNEEYEKGCLLYTSPSPRDTR